MSDDAASAAPSPLELELAYYKREGDRLAAEHLQHEYAISNLRIQLVQKRQGFALLSALSSTFGSDLDIDAILRNSIDRLFGTLAMDRAIVLRPSPDGNGLYDVTVSLGYPSEEPPLAESIDMCGLSEVLIANGATVSTPHIEAMRRILRLPFLVVAPVVVDENAPAVGYIIAGRVRETRPRVPPLDDGDADTFRSLVGLIAASIRNMRIQVLEQMDTMKNRFFANISHEFRTPITLTLGPIDSILRGRLGPVTAAQREHLEMMRRNQDRLLGLINQILDLAKLESHSAQLVVRPATSTLLSFLTDRASLFTGSFEQAGIELRVELPASIEGEELYLDLELVEKALVNLLINARKFTSKGHVTLGVEAQPASVSIFVRDTGMGIRAEEISQIFERFQQAAGSTSETHAGTGIGLALVREVTEVHGGKVTVESTYGEGTCFRLTFARGRAHFASGTRFVELAQLPGAPTIAPRDSLPPSGVPSVSHVESVVESEPTAASSSGEAHKPLILLAEDNPDLRTYVSGLLRPHYRVVAVEDGEYATEALARMQVDLILSDSTMPRCTGVELLRRVRASASTASIPFVLLTARASEDNKLEGLATGADDYLTKPFSEPELLARLANLIELRAKQVALRRELEAARAIQHAMLPALRQTFGPFRLEAEYEPSEELSGDFFDTILAGDSVFGFVADVTSHGTAAAQVTYVVKGMFRRAVVERNLRSLPEVYAALADDYRVYGLAYDVGIQIFRLDLQTRVLDVLQANAPAALLLSGGHIRVLKGKVGAGLTARPPGAQVASPEAASVVLSDDDAVFFFSDGCLEFKTSQGREFGIRHFVRMLEESPENVFDRLRALRANEPFPDDLTLLKLHAPASSKT